MDMWIRLGEDVWQWANGIAAGIIPWGLAKQISHASENIVTHTFVNPRPLP
jgi:hypothetical protein